MTSTTRLPLMTAKSLSPAQLLRSKPVHSAVSVTPHQVGNLYQTLQNVVHPFPPNSRPVI